MPTEPDALTRLLADARRDMEMWTGRRWLPDSFPALVEMVEVVRTYIVSTNKYSEGDLQDALNDVAAKAMGETKC